MQRAASCEIPVTRHGNTKLAPKLGRHGWNNDDMGNETTDRARAETAIASLILEAMRSDYEYPSLRRHIISHFLLWC